MLEWLQKLASTLKDQKYLYPLRGNYSNKLTLCFSKDKLEMKYIAGKIILTSCIIC